jgi:hypothetical protein
MKKLVLGIVALGVALPAAPAAADPPPWAPAHGRRAKDAQRYEDQRYSSQVPLRYGGDGRLGYDDRVWRGDDGRYRCRRPDGTTGLIVGGAAGALLGRALDGGRSRTVGTLVGGAAGALLGREIERGSVRCR